SRCPTAMTPPVTTRLMKHAAKVAAGTALLLLPSLAALAQRSDLLLKDWRPKAQLVAKRTAILKPKFPVIDIHNHLRDLEKTEEYLAEMDKAGVWKCVSLDARSAGDFYKEHIRVSHSVARERFVLFFRPDFSKIDEPDFGRREAERLEEAVRLGCRGLKIAKSLGLSVKDKSGKLVPVDDPRLDPIWAKCGELGIPVMIHVSDPKAFFTPLDRFNERWDALHLRPNWLFYGDQFPSKEELLEQRNRVIARHPETIFIGAHVGNLPEELHQVAKWLDVYPNFYVDIDARMGELGRQPYTARRFMIQYQDRILFGSDTPPNAEAYRVYYRFLETDDEYFDPNPAHPYQGRWKVYGLYLPDEVLEKIYNGNALKIFAEFRGVQ
ncbi:MAG TPA: amidohydrolase, partial [Bryobacterales bacterium]|nr:amidohydrolase [Bryobacterales bacterium]